MSKQYRLLKDLPNCAKGELFNYDGKAFYAHNGRYAFLPPEIEGNPDWFEEVKPFEWTDELVREYVNQIVYKKVKDGWEIDLNMTLEQFKKSKQ